MQNELLREIQRSHHRNAGHKSLKKFSSAGRGFWSDVPDSDWNDWHWQLKHRITSLQQLQRLMPTLTPEEFAGHRLGQSKTGAGNHALLFQPDRSGRRGLSDSLAGDPADRGDPYRFLGNDRSMRRRFPLACARLGPSISRPGSVSGHRSVRRLLPILHSFPAGQQRHWL